MGTREVRRVSFVLGRGELREGWSKKEISAGRRVSRSGPYVLKASVSAGDHPVSGG